MARGLDAVAKTPNRIPRTVTPRDQAHEHPRAGVRLKRRHGAREMKVGSHHRLPTSGGVLTSIRDSGMLVRRTPGCSSQAPCP